MENVIIKKGAGLISVQVWTGKLKGRPFPAYAVLCDIKKDGTVIEYPASKRLRADIIKNMV